MTVHFAPIKTTIHLRPSNNKMKFFLLKFTALALVASTGVSSHELRGSELQPSRRLSCNWKSGDDKMKPGVACASRVDGHTVPYTCDGKHPNICCNDSTITKATMERFGTCKKVTTSDSEDDQADIETTNFESNGVAGSNYCGYTWEDANSQCKTACHGGVDSECPGEGQKCYADMTNPECVSQEEA
mmetsp:Transcript_11086/g.24427  ORF Transcript_11086/g.24427 Transcript_11086/m.24427 type:complete len:187 (+) Transcript_11086:113-673(+)